MLYFGSFGQLEEKRMEEKAGNKGKGGINTPAKARNLPLAVLRVGKDKVSSLEWKLWRVIKCIFTKKQGKNICKRRNLSVLRCRRMTSVHLPSFRAPSFRAMPE